MEGVGSRLGRASSRYGPATATVFSGPVRKWKKQWVHVSSSSSSSSTVSYHSSRSNNGNSNSSSSSNNNSKASALMLCRWTPITPSQAADPDNNSGMPDEPPRRKFRYIPIVVLEEQKKDAAEKVVDISKTSSTNSLTTGTTSKSDDTHEKFTPEGAFTEETQEENKNQLVQQHSNASYLNLDLGLKGHDENNESDGEEKLSRVGSSVFLGVA